MTNPPFAGTVKERDILRLYKLAEKNGRLIDKIGRHILFLERSLQFIRPSGRMAIVLPQGIFNNTTAAYIRRYYMEEARILAVVGLHVNTFKPHTGTKTSVLFLQKYTEEEKQEIEEIKAKYEREWEEFFSELKKKYENVGWDCEVNEDDLSEELNSFLETYFEEREEIESIDEEKSGDTEEAEVEEDSGKKPLNVLMQEKQELEEALREKESELEDIESNRARELKKEIRTLNSKIRKLVKELLQRTLGGQINLVLNDERIREQFKKFWLDGQVIKEMDYPIFFAVNQKPLKDNKGEYQYKKGPNGEILMDKHGHPIIDHDLDEIASAFIAFAKKEGFDFWRE